MPVLAICPICSKTVSVERIPLATCSGCGSQFGFAELQRKHLIVDKRAEAAELATAKDFFVNSEYLSAHEHFIRALKANKNSYSAKYFSLLCDIYLNESSDRGKNDGFDIISAVVDMIKESLVTMSRASVTGADKLAFITAMLNETKIIVKKKLSSNDELFEKDVDEYRNVSIAELNKLLALFKIDQELIMSFAPEVAKILLEFVDCAIKVCYKAVQTVAVGDELHSPSDTDYLRISALCNELCFFGHSYDPEFDARSYSPDFSQNYRYNERVLNKFAKFDEGNKQNAKKYLIGDIDKYESILAECSKALRFTYLSCYRSMCSKQVEEHAKLFFDGFDMLYRLLLPRIAMLDKKKIEVRTPNFVDISEWCDILTRFLVDAYVLDPVVGTKLHNFYEKLCDIVSMYFVPEIQRLSKIKDSPEVRAVYQKTLFDCACCCAPALTKYVDFSSETDKARNKLVKICKSAIEDFLLGAGMSIDEIEQSNFYRPILQLSTAAMDEDYE